MPKGMEGYETGESYTKPEYAAEGKPVTKHGGRGELQDGKVTMGESNYPKADVAKADNYQ